MKRLSIALLIIMFALFGIAGGLGYTRYIANGSTEILQSPAAITPSAAPALVETQSIEVLVTEPQILSIPRINVNAPVESVGEDGQGRMDVPKNVYNVGWYNLGFMPGEKGSAVIAGHLDTITGAPAVFYYISQLSVGDEVIVTDKNGRNLTFIVTNVQSYPFDAVPLQDIFGEADKPKLNLITCIGTWDVGSRNYSNRLVVYTELRS